MNVTRRGWGVLAIVVFCLVMAWAYGARSLNALVAPLIVGLLAAVISVHRVDRPTVRRQPIEEGFVGETRPVALEIDVDTPIAATVSDTLEDGLTATGAVGETTLSSGCHYRYEVTLEERGEHTVGPVSITITDVLGLTTRRFEYEETGTALVYPDVCDLRGASRHDLQALTNTASQHNREEFDSLREYVRGDSLRDVHWKSTAKHLDGDLVVKQFVADETLGAVDLVAESARDTDAADELATATASIAAFLLEMGVAVGLTAPNGSRRTETGYDQQLRIFRLLARTTGGAVDGENRQDGDIVIRATAAGAVVHVGDREIPFDRFRVTPGRSARSGSSSSGTRRETDDRLRKYRPSRTGSEGVA